MLFEDLKIHIRMDEEHGFAWMTIFARADIQAIRTYTINAMITGSIEIEQSVSAVCFI